MEILETIRNSEIGKREKKDLYWPDRVRLCIGGPPVCLCAISVIKQIRCKREKERKKCPREREILYVRLNYSNFPTELNIQVEISIDVFIFGWASFSVSPHTIYTS